jgi:hypothetical protein
VPTALLIPAATAPFLPPLPTLFAALALRAVAATNAFTGAILLVNDACPPGALGRVNGAASLLSNAVRTVGPALGGVSWAWSLELAASGWLPSGLHQYLPFGLVGVVVAVAVGVYGVLHEHKLPQPVLAMPGLEGGRKEREGVEG